MWRAGRSKSSSGTGSGIICIIPVKDWNYTDYSSKR